MRLPSCRSAWPSIQPPIASRSWLDVSFIAIRMSACAQHVLVHDRRPLRDQPRDKTADAAAADNFFDIAEQAFPAFDRPLRRPEIGFVEDQLQRLFVGFVKSFGKMPP